MEELTFEQWVNIALVVKGMSKKELCEAVTERTGKFCDYSLLRRIFTGQTPGTNIREAVCKILDIDLEG